MKKRVAQFTVMLVCLLLGLLLMVQLRSQQRFDSSTLAASSIDQSLIIDRLVESNDGLRQEVETLQGQVAHYQQINGGSKLEELVNELNQLKIINGLAEASGPGVEVEINEAISLVEMQDMINELRNAGAEVLAINDQRLIVSSVIAADADGIVVDGVKLSRPYVFQALGHPETIERALVRKGGLVALLESNYEGLKIKVTKRDRLILHRTTRPIDLTHATPTP